MSFLSFIVLIALVSIATAAKENEDIQKFTRYYHLRLPFKHKLVRRSRSGSRSGTSTSTNRIVLFPTSNQRPYIPPYPPYGTTTNYARPNYRIDDISYNYNGRGLSNHIYDQNYVPGYYPTDGRYINTGNYGSRYNGRYDYNVYDYGGDRRYNYGSDTRYDYASHARPYDYGGDRRFNNGRQNNRRRHGRRGRHGRR